MTNYEKAMFAVMLVLALAVFTLFVGQIAEAQEVTYCKNYQTGEIIVVEAGYPCPYPSVEL